MTDGDETGSSVSEDWGSALDERLDHIDAQFKWRVCAVPELYVLKLKSCDGELLKDDELKKCVCDLEAKRPGSFAREPAGAKIFVRPELYDAALRRPNFTGAGYIVEDHLVGAVESGISRILVKDDKLRRLKALRLTDRVAFQSATPNVMSCSSPFGAGEFYSSQSGIFTSAQRRLTLSRQKEKRPQAPAPLVEEWHQMELRGQVPRSSPATKRFGIVCPKTNKEITAEDVLVNKPKSVPTPDSALDPKTLHQLEIDCDTSFFRIRFRSEATPSHFIPGDEYYTEGCPHCGAWIRGIWRPTGKSCSGCIPPLDSGN